eukprot:COSAG06_NODE_1066_length_10841_cov_14.808806_6_plen_76_part_00
MDSVCVRTHCDVVIAPLHVLLCIYFVQQAKKAAQSEDIIRTQDGLLQSAGAQLRRGVVLRRGTARYAALYCAVLR